MIQETQKGILRVCCADRSNHDILGQRLGDTSDILVFQCRLCKRKHYRMVIKPIQFGTTIQPLGN